MSSNNPIIEAIRARRSVRHYTGEALSKEQLETIIDCGRLAPSARNEQVWEFVVATKPDLLSSIAAAMPYNGPFVAEAGACIVVCGPKNYRNVYLDCAAAVQNMLLAAHALGLGSCWVQAFEKDYNSEVALLLGIPDDYALVAVVALGVPSGSALSPKKRPLEDVMHLEKFKSRTKKKRKHGK